MAADQNARSTGWGFFTDDRFLGLAVDGRRVRFCENVFYRFRDGRIVTVWSVIDKAAIEAQL